MTAQLIPVQFRGVEEGDDPKALPPGTLLLAENCAMDKARRLCKRAGTTGLVRTATSGSNPAAGKRLLTGGARPSMTDGATAWSYVNAISKWSPTDRPPSWRATKRTLVDTARSIGAVDIAIYSTMLISTYQTLPTAGGTDAAVFVRIDDLETGDPILAPTWIANLGSAVASYPRVLVSGTTAYAFFSVASSIGYSTINLSTLAVAAATTLVADSDAAYPTQFDVVIGTPTAGVPTLYLAYERNAGTLGNLTIASFTVSTMAAIASLEPSVGSNAITAISITFGALAQRISVFYSTTLTRLVSCTTALGSAVGPTTLYGAISSFTFVVEDDATNLLVGWQRNDGAAALLDAERLTTGLYSVAAHTLVAASVRVTFQIYYPSAPWRTGGRWFLAATTFLHPYSLTAAPMAAGSSVVLEIETANSLTGIVDATHPHVGTLESQTGWSSPYTFQVKSAVDASGLIYIPAAYRLREPISSSEQIPVGFNVYALEASGGDTFRSAPLGASALLAGAAPAWNDGLSTMPYGFAHAPQIVSVTPAAGGAIVAGTYSYIVTYAWRDARGLLHRSTPSHPVTGVTATTNLKLIVKVATSSLSSKQRASFATKEDSPVFVEIWRTTIGGTGPHYRLTYEPAHNMLINDPKAADVSFTDDKADTAIDGAALDLNTQPQLYTELGELANVPPPSLITVATHRGRLVGIGPDLRTLWFSKDSTEDVTVAPGFNEALTLAFASDKAALASLDDKLVVFGERTIDLVYGDGPDATGGSNTWQIQAVQTDVGCANPRSVVTCPMGALFESARGIELLSRAIEVSWVGRRAADTLTTYPVITSAVLVAEQEEVRFTCNTTDGTTGIVLAWDYGYKNWFVRRYTDLANTLAANIPFVDAALVDGVYTMLTAGGQVYQESTSTKLENGTGYVPMDIVLAPISPVSNLNWHRVKDVTVMGTSVTDHDLKVSLARDYATSYEQDVTFAANTLPTATGPKELCRVTMANQKCQAVKIRIQDITPSAGSVGTGAGPIIEALGLRVAVRPGSARTAPAQQG